VSKGPSGFHYGDFSATKPTAMMWLVNDRLGRRVLVARYDPYYGWGLADKRNFNSRLSDALFENYRPLECPRIATTDWRLEYEKFS
jgi:hypothetical protein